MQLLILPLYGGLPYSEQVYKTLSLAKFHCYHIYIIHVHVHVHVHMYVYYVIVPHICVYNTYVRRVHAAESVSQNSS